MPIRDVTLSEIELLNDQAAEAEVAFEMDEESFRAFYERTARPLCVYLLRLTGNAQAAEDLLQESYYRFLRARQNWQSESHRRAYLYRIATNLVRDGHRRGAGRTEVPEDRAADLASGSENVADRAARRTDLVKAMAQLKPRERALLWLAYAQEHPHAEIAQVLGIKRTSVKLLLFRARRKLAKLLNRRRDVSEGKTDADR